MKVDEFDFALPRALIAERPADPRDSARLLHVAPGGLADVGMGGLPGLLAPGDIMVFNDTRVIPARLFGRRGTAAVELTLHQRTGPAEWKAFARPAKKLRPGDRVDFAPGFAAEIAAKGEAGEVCLAFDRADAALMAALEQFGRLPLPPYIRKGEADQRDRADYQTVFAREDGAVAAPTAGLHFTPALLAALDGRGIRRTAVTLHVGAGTFLPVKVDDTRDHRMHAENGRLSAEAAEAINAARASGGRVVAVGTTALRLLESAAEPCGTLRPFEGSTDIFITPGHRFRVADLLLTNFHLPRSTLFMLVAAFSGLGRMRAAYEHAKAGGYRFYSYGDACLLHRESHDRP
jgi:S-adenosylmethionine:tRNA ribosyltransferase-isomerase